MLLGELARAARTSGGDGGGTARADGPFQLARDPTTGETFLRVRVAAACPCAGTWTTHGQYVGCVAHERNVLRKARCLTAGVPKKGLVRCAARSTCGKVGAVVCCPVHPGKGHVTHDAASCVAGGGVSDGTGSVCHSTCSPSGAFLDAAF